jgi:putative DNA primase/helicase
MSPKREHWAISVPVPDRLPSPEEPLEVAGVFAGSFGREEAGRVLLRWRGDFWFWYGSNWRVVEDEVARQWVYYFTKRAVYGDSDRSWSPSKVKVERVLDALGALVLVDEQVQPPVRLGPSTGEQAVVVSCANGLLDVETRSLAEHDPQFFNQIAVPFDYDPKAPEPERWLQLMRECWPDDPASIAALQEWFGYVVSGRLDQQKILYIQGPARAGKGTISKVLEALVGPESVASPTLDSLTTNFGLQQLISKSLAVIQDAGENRSAKIAERLKTISGEDSLSFDRKYKEHWTGRLLTRIMVLSNVLPSFQDPSGVLATRFLLLQLEHSHLGGEDLGLADTLRPELPGILNWALDGLDRLEEQGRFTQPARAEEQLAALQDFASPVHAFVRDRCQVAPELRVDKAGLYSNYNDWSVRNGFPAMNSSEFGARLRAVVPTLGEARGGKRGEKRPEQYTGIGL